jgi:MFS family permease
MANSYTNEGYLVSKRYAYYVFFVLFIIYMIDYADRYVISGLIPYLKAPISEGGLAFSDQDCGLLVSAVYWSIVVLTFPLSIMIDRWRRTRSLGILVFLWSLATGSCAFTTNFRQLFTARVAVGVGESGYVPGGYSLISAFFPEKKRELMIGIWNGSIPLGIVMGSVLGGIIAVHLGWRHAFGIMAIPGLVLASLFFLMKDYKTVDLLRTVTGAKRKTEKVKMKVKDIVREFLDTPSLLLTYFGYAGCVFVNNALILWLPAYFNRLDGLPMDKATMKTAIVFLLAVLGAPLGGIITNALQKRFKTARLVFPAISTFAAAILLFAAFHFFKGQAQYFALIAMGLAAPMFVAGSSAVTQDVVHPGLRSISYSLAIIVQNLLGASLGPLFIGVVSDHYMTKFNTNPAMALVAGFKFLPIFFAIGALFFLAGSFFYLRDLAKVERVALEPED